MYVRVHSIAEIQADIRVNIKMFLIKIVDIIMYVLWSMFTFIFYTQ